MSKTKKKRNSYRTSYLNNGTLTKTMLQYSNCYNLLEQLKRKYFHNIDILCIVNVGKFCCVNCADSQG